MIQLTTAMIDLRKCALRETTRKGLRVLGFSQLWLNDGCIIGGLLGHVSLMCEEDDYPRVFLWDFRAMQSDEIWKNTYKCSWLVDFTSVGNLAAWQPHPSEMRAVNPPYSTCTVHPGSLVRSFKIKYVVIGCALASSRAWPLHLQSSHKGST